MVRARLELQSQIAMLVHISVDHGIPRIIQTSALSPGILRDNLKHLNDRQISLDT